MSDLISCLCPTFNRPPHSTRLLEESIASFISQDDPNKELIIGNDCPEQRLICDAPNVRVVNFDKRFETLSDKLIAMIEIADGDLICRWDDDDICLPHRLSYSRKKLGDDLEWRPGNYIWWLEGKRELHRIEHPGNTHCMALWRRSVLELIDGYPAKRSGDEDQQFNQKLERAGISSHLGEIIPNDAVFYVYRWGVSSTHLSGRRELQEHWDAIGDRSIESGSFDITPKRWPILDRLNELIGETVTI